MNSIVAAILVLTGLVASSGMETIILVERLQGVRLANFVEIIRLDGATVFVELGGLLGYSLLIGAVGLLHLLHLVILPLS